MYKCPVNAIPDTAASNARISVVLSIDLLLLGLSVRRCGYSISWTQFKSDEPRTQPR